MADLMTGGWLSGYKTYVTAAVTAVGAVAAYLMGDASLMDAAQLVATAAMGAFIRHGVSTSA